MVVTRHQSWLPLRTPAQLSVMQQGRQEVAFVPLLTEKEGRSWKYVVHFLPLLSKHRYAKEPTPPYFIFKDIYRLHLNT